MILAAGRLPDGLCQQNCSVWENEKFLIAWKGTVFRYGKRAGVDSIVSLASELENQALCRICHLLHGSFGIFIFYKDTGIWQITVDNSGLYQVFHDEDSVSTSFLELLSHREVSTTRISPEAVAEFLAHGGVYWQATFVDGISKIAHDEIIELCRDDVTGELTKRVLRKELPIAGSYDEQAFERYFTHLANALVGQRVSVDLTAGVDSRLMACMLDSEGLDFEVAISGRPNIPDVVVSERAAAILGKDLYVTFHDVSHIEEELEGLFRDCDGLCDVLTFHRLRQLQADRRRRGVTVAICGDGGGLYKDFWWLQDLPYYNSRRVDFERLYDLRIAPIALPNNYLSGDVADAYAGLRRKTLTMFERLREETNTMSYDNVKFYYQDTESDGRDITNIINNDMQMVAPLLDYHNFLVGFSLPRSLRFFNRFHRRRLSERCPDLAALTTGNGMSAASGIYMVRDLLGYGTNMAARAAKKAGQRMLGRTWLKGPGPDAPDLVPRVRKSQEFARAMVDLKEAGLLNSKLGLHSVRDADVGRLLTLGMLLRHLRR